MLFPEVNKISYVTHSVTVVCVMGLV